MRQGRRPDELRSTRIEVGCLPHAEGSAIIECGATRVICSASVEDRVPPHLLGTGKGWVTAEYAMLPRATTTRQSRGPSGRSSEIQRLIGRALRAVIDLRKLGSRTLVVDCDVVVADGGTRTASITGGFVALALALRRLRASGVLPHDPIREAVAAVSVGVVEGEPVLDLPYEEDAQAQVDMNVVMTASGRFVELQGTAESGTFDELMLSRMCGLATVGIRKLCEIQRQALAQ